MISQQLVILAKDNGSTDNITVVVVFLKPVEEILQKIHTQYHHLQNPFNDEYDTVDSVALFAYTKIPDLQLYEGITSTSKFVTDAIMNGDSTENLTNGDDVQQHGGHPIIDDTPSPGIKANNNNPFSNFIDLGLPDKQFQGDSPANCGNNPFSSPGAQAFGDFGEGVNPFTDMSGGDSNAFDDGRGMMGTHSSSEGGDDSLDGSCSDVMMSQEGGLLNLSGEEFKQASPSMFEESKSPSMFERPPVEAASFSDAQALNEVVPDIGANPLTNPFLPNNKFGDSGFISPAGNSQHQSASASSEDSAENREERESVERASSVGSDRQSDAASVHESTAVEKRESISSKNEEHEVEDKEKDIEESDDEEAREHQEVKKLLSGGGMDPLIGELMASANRETPTPPAEENGKSKNYNLGAKQRVVFLLLYYQNTFKQLSF